MNPHVRDKLCQIVARYGAPVDPDTRRYVALLRDLCPQHKREIHVLIAALSERIPAELVTLRDPRGAIAAIGRQTKRLEDNLALAAGPARWAVESWAVALGAVTREQLAPAPKAASSGRGAPGAVQNPKAVTSHRTPKNVAPPPVITLPPKLAPPKRLPRPGRVLALAVLLLMLLPGAVVGLAWSFPTVRELRRGKMSRPSVPVVSTAAADGESLELLSPPDEPESVEMLDRQPVAAAPLLGELSAPISAEEEAVVRGALRAEPPKVAADLSR
jgi:hypothetical protein